MMEDFRGGGALAGLGLEFSNFSNDTCPQEISLYYHCLKCQPCFSTGYYPLLCPPYTDPDTGQMKQDLMCNTSSCADGFSSGPTEILCIPVIMTFFLKIFFWTAVASAGIVLCLCTCGVGCGFRAQLWKLRRQRALRPQKPEAWIRAGPRKYNADGGLYPSALWRGHFTHGARFEVPDHEMIFTGGGSGQSSGHVLGSGLDAGGRFEIEGIHNARTRRVAFKKRYEVGSKDTHGREVPDDVQRKIVEYRGEPAGSTVGAGISGRWFVPGAERSGVFLIWPAAVDGDQEAAVTFLEAATESFCVAEGGPCVVCFDGFIDTKLAPCGHVAVCRLCAEQLAMPLRCPICRGDVEAVVYCSSARSSWSTAPQSRSSAFALVGGSSAWALPVTAAGGQINQGPPLGAGLLV